MTKKILRSRKKTPKSKKRVTFSNLQGGKSDSYEPGSYPFQSAQFFKKSNITTVPLVKKTNVTSTLTAKNVKPVPILKNSNSKPKSNSKFRNTTKIGGKSLQNPSNALFTSTPLKTTNSRGTVIDTDKFNRQWSLSKQYANYPMNVGIYASSMPAAKSNTGGRKLRKTKSKQTRGGRKLKSQKRKH